MKNTFALVLVAGLIAFALATGDSSDLSHLKNTKDATKLPSSTPSSSDKVSVTKASSEESEESTSTSTENSGPKFCTRQYKPVCGSDGKTYNNQCEFENAQKLDSSLTLAKKEAC